MAKTKQHTSSALDHIKSILALPFMVIIVIPSLIYQATHEKELKVLSSLSPPLLNTLGVVFLIVGMFLFIKSIDLFIKIGNGTLAPWNPTKKLVVKSLYRHVRNPMIMGVVTILISEAMLFQSVFLLGWALIFFLINQIYFVLKEEPDLLKRFGDEYTKYKQNVPRWLPRWNGWRPEDE